LQRIIDLAGDEEAPATQPGATGRRGSGVQDIWATDGSGLPPMRDEEIDGSKSQVTVRVRTDPARALPRRCGTRQKSVLPRRTR